MKLADATKVNIKKVLEILENDGIIIYPTETLYGIGARFDSQIALKKNL